MVLFICLLFPAVLSVWIYEAVSKKQLSKKQWLYRYCLNVLLINGFVFLVKKFILGTSAELLAPVASEMPPEYAIRYLAVAVPATIALGVLEMFLSKHTKMTVEEDEDDVGKK